MCGGMFGKSIASKTTEQTTKQLNIKHMLEEGVLNWEKILTVIIGVIIVGTIYLVLRAMRRAKRRKIERDAMLQKSDKQKP